MRSSSSVVTPGWTWVPTSSRASAASRQATRIRAMVSASLTSLPVNGAGPGLSTYSGRGIEAGTARRGEIAAGAIAVEVMGRVYGAAGGSPYSAAMAYWFCVKHRRVEQTPGDV